MKVDKENNEDKVIKGEKRDEKDKKEKKEEAKIEEKRRSVIRWIKR